MAPLCTPAVTGTVSVLVLPVLDAYTKELAAMCSDSMIFLHADHWQCKFREFTCDFQLCLLHVKNILDLGCLRLALVLEFILHDRQNRSGVSSVFDAHCVPAFCCTGCKGSIRARSQHRCKLKRV